ncbi:MAG: hypothetical protein HC779_03745 [Phyllobacteriaceae bacterium]|nr:hypothetical protein [Phyllobacteriaceae bacterium]
MSLNKIAVLVPGRLNAHADARVGGTFKRVSIASADAALLSAADREAIVGMAAMTRIDAAFIDALPNLRIIANFGVGYDAVDAAHAAAKGIIVTHTPDVLNECVSDVAMALVLGAKRSR